LQQLKDVNARHKAGHDADQFGIIKSSRLMRRTLTARGVFPWPRLALSALDAFSWCVSRGLAALDAFFLARLARLSSARRFFPGASRAA
jgi:hypothetical protein